MHRTKAVLTLLFLLAILAPASKAQLGKSVSIPAGSEVDHQLNAITDATDPQEKLKLIQAFGDAHKDDQYAGVADEQFVNYYLNAKDYAKAFEYGDKLFAFDPDNYTNAVNMIRAANEKGDLAKLFAYGEKSEEILKRVKDAPAPAGESAESWESAKAQKLASVKDERQYIEQSLFTAAYQEKDPAKKADYLQKYAKIFPGSPNADQALTMAAFAYQQAQNRAKMLELANDVLAKNPDNIGMLLLLADDYSERSEQLDKAETYAKKAAALCDTAKKPEGVSDADWQNQISLQKGLALSALGQVNLEKKDNASAVKNLTAAAPLLKSNAVTYARNQYRLGYAYINLKNSADAKTAFTQAASVDSPYKAKAEAKLKELGATKPGAKKKA